MSLAGLIPPHELKGLDTVCQYLAAAIATNKRATIVADYDCDGATACAIGIRGLRMLGLDGDFLVTNRFKDGYGLTQNIVDQVLALDRKTDFIITVDNGIASIDGVAYAHQHHLDVVITDHHLAGEQIPDTNLIVNPNQPGCRFPSKSLAGCGVMFYVLLGLRALLRDKGAFTRQDQPKIESLLDLVALGTCFDFVNNGDQNS
jgi:single-stranded-DNA-specific exonuclease